MSAIDQDKYILLAEDNPADVDLVRVAFDDRGVGCELCVVTDGETAVELIDQIDRDLSLFCPKALLLDLHLPKVSGEEILQHFRASRRCGRTPVVVMTSAAHGRDIENALSYSMVSYFRKPTCLEHFLELGDVVKQVIAGDECAPEGEA